MDKELVRRAISVCAVQGSVTLLFLSVSLRKFYFRKEMVMQCCSMAAALQRCFAPIDYGSS